jgi:hypothetical protein
MTEEEIVGALKDKWDYWTLEKIEEFYGNRTPPNRNQEAWRYCWEIADDGVYLIHKGTGINDKVSFERNDGTIYTLRPDVIPNYWDLIRNIYIEAKLYSNKSWAVEIPVKCETVSIDGKDWDFMVTMAPNNEIGRSGHADFLDPASLADDNFLPNLITEIGEYSKIYYKVTQEHGFGMPEMAFCSENRWESSHGKYWRHATGNISGGFTSTFGRAKAFGYSILKLLYIPTFNVARVHLGISPLTEEQIAQLLTQARTEWQI